MLFPGHKLFSSLVAFKICLHHASVTLFVSGAAPPKIELITLISHGKEC